MLDLRLNGGGSLTEAINLTGLFIHDGPVVQVKDADGRVTPYDDHRPGIAWAGPLVVLTSKFSASASEIFAGAIQDYHRGLIVGDHSTHGKGTVQSLLNLGEQLFRFPNAPKMGALEDHHAAVLSPRRRQHAETRRVGGRRTPLAHHAPRRRRGRSGLPAAFDQVAAAAVQALRLRQPAGGRSASPPFRQRAAPASEKFQKVAAQHRPLQGAKGEEVVTLNEAKFLKERAELNADKEEEKAMEKLNDANAATIKRDFYLDEVLTITADYINCLKQVAKAN